MDTATSVITVVHENVFVTPGGRVKIAPTKRTEHRRNPWWRMWIYVEATDVWEVQPEIFKRLDEAEAAAMRVDRRLEETS